MTREDNGVTSAPKRVVYSALTGRYEQLNEQPIARETDIEFICLTDDPELTSETWTIRRVPLRFPMDTIRSARYLKVRGTELLPEYDESLWIDNSVRLHTAPDAVLDDWLASTDLAIPRHSYRETVLAEFDAVATDGYDDPARVYEQLIQYSALRPGCLEEHPYWTALLARRHTPAVTDAMRLWYDHILRFSRRDQLSINFILAELDLPVRRMDIDNMRSEWHEWPVRSAKKWALAQDRLANALRVPQVELGRLESQLAALQSKLESAEARAAAAIESTRSEVRDEYQASASWKITAPLRALFDVFRRK